MQLMKEIGENWMNTISFCADFAKNVGLDPYVYDENVWQSETWK